jgi:signal transduction histidine kinase
VPAAEPAAPDSPFPIVAAIEGLEGWLRRPGPERRELDEFLAGIMRVIGARGAFLRVDTDLLPAFEVAFGTLDGPDAAERRRAAQEHELHADDGRTHLATLWLDGAGANGPLGVRAVELALEGAWARATTRAAAERLAALEDAIRGIAVLDVDRVLQLIADRVRELVGARYAALGIVGPGESIERFVTSGITLEQRLRLGPPPRGHGLLGLIIREGRSLRIPNIAAHPNSYGFPPNHPPMTTLLGVPVTVKGQPIGNFYLTDKEDGREFSEADQQLVENFAVHAGIAIENARLHDQVQRLAIVEERERISKDLHDGIIQGLYGIALSLEDLPELMEDDREEAVGRVDRAIDGLNVTIQDIRSFIQGLHSELGLGGDLADGLASLAHEFRLNSLVDVDVDLDGGRAAASILPVGHRVHLLNIAREALSNASRHGRAPQGRIELATEGEQLVLTITDDGVGFDPRIDPGEGHLGLANLRSRAATMRGTALVDSAPGKGTRIIVRVPVEVAQTVDPREAPHA